MVAHNVLKTESEEENIHVKRHITLFMSVTDILQVLPSA